MPKCSYGDSDSFAAVEATFARYCCFSWWVIGPVPSRVSDSWKLSRHESAGRRLQLTVLAMNLRQRSSAPALAAAVAALSECPAPANAASSERQR